MEESKQSIRTKKFLSNTLLNLIIKRDFENISVVDICEEAMMTRATFYKYFADKYDLAIHTLDELKKEIFENTLKNFQYKSPKELYLKIVQLCYDFVNQHQRNAILFIKHSYNDKLRIMLLQTINSYIEEITKKELPNFKFKIPAEIISKFTTGGFAYLLLFLIENNAKYTKNEILKWTNEVLDTMLVS